MKEMQQSNESHVRPTKLRNVYAHRQHVGNVRVTRPKSVPDGLGARGTGNSAAFSFYHHESASKLMSLRAGDAWSLRFSSSLFPLQCLEDL